MKVAVVIICKCKKHGISIFFHFFPLEFITYYNCFHIIKLFKDGVCSC